MNKKAKEYWLVALQFLLFALYFLNPLKIKIYNGFYLQHIALIMAVLGVTMLLLSIYALRKSISPFPSPNDKATLINSGIYHYVRHPIYSAILISALGWSIYSNSCARIIIFVLLCWLFVFKSNFEEKLLIKRYPNYVNYKKVTGKFIPKIKLK